MNTVNVFPDFPERLNRFPRPIEDHVRRVEIDKQIVAADIFDELQQTVSALLASLKMKRLSVLLAMTANVLRHGDYLLI